MSLVLATAAHGALAQGREIATPGTILAVIDGMTDLRRMVVDCAPDRAPRDEAASWSEFRDRVAIALETAGREPAFVAEALARLDGPGAMVGCDVAEWHLASVSHGLRDGGWSGVMERTFAVMGIPLPESIPDRGRWDAVAAAVLAEAEAMRRPLVCMAVLMPRDVIFLTMQLQRNGEELARVLSEAGFSPEDIAALNAMTGPDALLPAPDADRAALIKDCLENPDDLDSVRRSGAPRGVPDSVMQILGAP